MKKNPYLFQEELLGDSSKAKKVLNWQPKYDFDVSPILML